MQSQSKVKTGNYRLEINEAAHQTDSDRAISTGPALKTLTNIGDYARSFASLAAGCAHRSVTRSTHVARITKTGAYNES